MNQKSESPIIYLITKDMPLDKQMKKLKSALSGGIDFLQYRRKTASINQKKAEIAQLKLLCQLFDTTLIVNDSADLAKSMQVNWVHLGQDDLEIGKMDSYAPLHLGVTAKTVAQSQSAETIGASYIGVGAIYPSSTKDNAIPISLSDLKAIKASVNIPLYLIGGLRADNITPQLKAYADGYVFCDYILSHTNPKEAVKAIRARL